MQNSVLYIGIDVDDNSYHLGTFDPATGEQEVFKIAPTLTLLKKKLDRLKGNKELRCCYEATYIGYSLARRLESWGYSCEIVAPSLIPKSPGDRVKTDRLDSLKLARLFATQMLSIVKKPSVEAESHRRLIRSRKFLVGQSTQIKNRINSLCRTLGLNFKEQCAKENYWTPAHRQWLNEQCSLNGEMLGFELGGLLEHLEKTQDLIERYDDRIKALAETTAYSAQVKALISYRAIDTLSAMTIVTEIFDIDRFAHPRQLMSYAGLDVIEYSSGGKERKFGISKMGNNALRITTVEASQLATKPPSVSRALKYRRLQCDPNLVKIADRCMVRLHKKGNRMLHAGKQKNKIKVALAREMLGFIWESLKQSKLELQEIKH